MAWYCVCWGRWMCRHWNERLRRSFIGMKICANGDFSNDPAARQESVRFAINNPHIHAIVIGMRSTREVDENISLVNQALAPA